MFEMSNSNVHVQLHDICWRLWFTGLQIKANSLVRSYTLRRNIEETSKSSIISVRHLKIGYVIVKFAQLVLVFGQLFAKFYRPAR